MEFLPKRCPDTAGAEANYSYGLEYGKPDAADPIPTNQMRTSRLGHQQEEQLQLEELQVRSLTDSARSVSPECCPNTRSLLAPDDQTTRRQSQPIAPNCEPQKGFAAKCFQERRLAKPAVAGMQQLLHGGSTVLSYMQPFSTQHAVAPPQTLLGSFSEHMNAADSAGPVLIPAADTAKDNPAIPQSSASNHGPDEQHRGALPEVPQPQQAPRREQYQRQQISLQNGKQPQPARPEERDSPCADLDTQMPDADDDGSVAAILLSMRHAVAEDDGAAQGGPAGAACEDDRGLHGVGDVDGLDNDGEQVHNDGNKSGNRRSRVDGSSYLQPEEGDEEPLADVEVEELQVQEGMIDAGGGVYVTPSTAGPGISFRSLAGAQGGPELYSSLARKVRSRAPSQSPNPRGLKRPRAAAVRSPPAFTQPATQSPASTGDKAASQAAATTAAITAAAATGGMGSALPLAALLGRMSPALLRTVLASLSQAAANALVAALSGMAEGAPTAAAAAAAEAGNCPTGAGGSRAGSEASDSSAGLALPLHPAPTRSPLHPAAQVATASAPLDADMESFKAGETRIAAAVPVSDGEDKAFNQQQPKMGDGSTNWQPPPRPPRNHKGPLMCANCGTTQTPLWRKDRISGSTVCNACGIYKQTHGFDRPVGGRSQAPQPLRRRTVQQRAPPSQQQQLQVLQQHQGASFLHNREGGNPSDGNDWQHHTPEETVVSAAATESAARPAHEAPGGAPVPSSSLALRQLAVTGVRRESADPGAGAVVAAAPQAGEWAQGLQSLERVPAEEPHVGAELERRGGLKRPGSGRASPAVSSRTLDRSPLLVGPRVFLLPDGSAVVATVSGADGANIGGCCGGADLLAADVKPPALVQQDDGLTNLRAVLTLAAEPAYGHQFLCNQQWQECDPVNSGMDLGHEVRRDDAVVARGRDPDPSKQPMADAAGGSAGCRQQQGPALAADMDAEPDPDQDQDKGADSGSSCCEVLGRPPEKEGAAGTALMRPLATDAAGGGKLGGAGQATSQLSTRPTAPGEPLHTTIFGRLGDEDINDAERQPSLSHVAKPGGLAIGAACAREGQQQQPRHYQQQQQQQERLVQSPRHDSVRQLLAPTQRPPRNVKVVTVHARPQAAVAAAAKGTTCVRLPNGRLAYVPVLPYPHPHPHTLRLAHPRADGEVPLVLLSQPQPSPKQQQQARLHHPRQLQERHSQEDGRRQVCRQGDGACEDGDGCAWKGDWARGNGTTDQPEEPRKTRVPHNGEPSTCRVPLADHASDADAGSTAAAGDGADTGRTFASLREVGGDNGSREEAMLQERHPEAGGADWQGVAVVAASRDLAGTAGSGSARYDGERRSRNEDGDVYSHSAGCHGNASNPAVRARIQRAATAANAGQVQLIRHAGAAAAEEYVTFRTTSRPNQQAQLYERFKQTELEAPSSHGLIKQLLVALQQHQVAPRPQQQPQHAMVAPVEGSGCGAGAGDDRDVPSVHRYSAGCSSDGGAAASGDASASGVLHSSGASGGVGIIVRRSALDIPWLGIGHQGPHRHQQQHPYLQPFHHAGYPVQPLPPGRSQVQVPHANYRPPYEQLDRVRDQDASHLRPHTDAYGAEHLNGRSDCQPLQHAPRYGLTPGRRWDAQIGEGLVLESDAGQPVLLVREGAAFQWQQAGPPSGYTVSATGGGPAGRERCYLQVNPEHGLVFSGRTAALEPGAALPQASRQAATGPATLVRIQPPPPLGRGRVPLQRVDMDRDDGGSQDAETGVNRFGGGGGGGGGAGAGRGLLSNGSEGRYWVLQLDAGGSDARRPAPSASRIRL